MRIGIDIRCLLEREPSGVAYYTKNLLANIFALDKKNQYSLFYNDYRQQNTELIKKFQHFSNVKICGFRYPNKILNAAINFFHFPKINKLLGEIDLFFAPNLEFISLSKNCKKVVTAHDLSFDLYPEFLSLKRKLWHKFINPRKFICTADKIIAVSQNTKNDLMNLYHIQENKITVIHSGVEAIHELPLRDDLPEKYILTISTLEPRKNIAGLIKAYKQLIQQEKFKDYHLLIAGPKGWKADHIYCLAEGEKKIKFLGFVSDLEKAQLYQKASAFVYPSFYEGFGFPPLEALNYQIPVIASSDSSLPEILQAAVLYVNPYDISEIKCALEQILSDNSLREQLINMGKEQSAKFNWQKSAAQTLAVFNSLV